MGISNPSILGSIQSKVWSWIADLSWVSCGDNWMSSGDMGDQKVCQDCHARLVLPGWGGRRCRSCGRLLCSECIRSSSEKPGWKYSDEEDAYRMTLCKSCSQDVDHDRETVGEFDDKLEPVLSPKGSSDVEVNLSMDARQNGSLRLQCTTTRSYDDDDDDDYGKNFLSPSSIFSHDVSDLESSSFSNSTDFYSFKSSPLNSPRRADQQVVSTPSPTSSLKAGVLDQEPGSYGRTPPFEMEELNEHASDYTENNSHFHEEVQNLYNLENDSDIWIPPPPKDAADDMEVGFFRYDDEDDDVVGSGPVIKSCSFNDCTFSIKDDPSDDRKEILRDSVHGHFKVLVSQMLRDEGLCDGSNHEVPNWLGIVSSLAWQAANFVKPDTSREGSMDPGDYVKVKCIPTGGPSDSVFVKGIVCTRNVRHKRMITQHKNPRILIFGGELEFQKAPQKLASMNTLITQKPGHLDIAFSKIDNLRPNVLLVEKCVSPDAAEYMLAKGISLVTNIKRPLLQKIAKCTGARITESLDDLPSTRVGTCDAFYINRVPEECPAANSVQRRSTKTLMFFDGCPRRLGCTILLKGTNLEELKKVKRVVQFAIFAAYHLSLETSFLADEGATLRKTQLGTSFRRNELRFDVEEFGLFDKFSSSYLPELSCDSLGKDHVEPPCNHAKHNLKAGSIKETSPFSKIHPTNANSFFPCDVQVQDLKTGNGEKSPRISAHEGKVGGIITSNEFSHAEKNQSILVSLSKSCKGMTCGKSQLLRIKFYGSFDKPLGRYLREDLFDQAPCESCKEATDTHVLCYTHQQGSLTINVKRLPSLRLPGERDGRIWMWHRCLKCASKDGFPPAGRRVVMSDAAWGLSFGKFLELSFSNHATANRLASCGHSLQRDCLRFYGFGSMVAFFRYAPVDILAVHLPPSVLDFSCQLQQKWLQQTVMNVSSEMEHLHDEVLELLCGMEKKICTSEFDSIREIILNHIADLKNLLEKERSSYDLKTLNVLELNRSRRSLLIDSYMWDRRIHHLDSLLKGKDLASSVDALRTRSISDEDGGPDYTFRLNSTKSLVDVHAAVNALSESNSTENLSEKIDLAWTGSNDASTMLTSSNSPHDKKVPSPQRFYSFESPTKTRERVRRLSDDSRQLASFNSLAYDSQKFQKVSPQNLPRDLQKLKGYCSVADGARLLLPLPDHSDVYVAVYDDEPSSIISYALSSKEHAEFVMSAPSIQLVDHDNASSGFVRPEDLFQNSAMSDLKQPHFRFTFEDEYSFPSNKAKFSVTCYFAKQFSSLRNKCCPNETDFIRSLSRCKKWSAEGGKSNAYFARSFDERFVIKQVTKTELESFEKFAPQYFKYVTESIKSGSPTCLAKIIGIFQVTVKNTKGGREVRTDLMVMENLFYGRNISRVYDLKGSCRSRYISEATGSKKVLLDSNLIEVLQTKPIFLGSKAKRKLERAVWNDTAFLASIDVMDYSLLVGIDDERKELVIGIIDFMRQYTWDKHLESWVKTSGILGGPKNTTPTIISPMQYKKRFRKAMSGYFLTVPDQWPS